MFKNKNCLVYGMSISGEWASKLLVKYKANVFLFDDDEDKLKTKPIKTCYVLRELNENLICQFDYIILSPSIEKDNKFVQIAKKNNIPILSEVELASKFCKRLVAITGTNGKTTTVELVTSMLKKRYKAIACGNIGYPLSRAVLENKKQICVCEVSSFMLENCNTFSPHVATILNIEPDHLVRHKTMEEYTKLKYNIFKNLTPRDYAVINLDNGICPTLDTLKITYSLTKNADIYLHSNSIFLHQEKIVNLNEIKLKGKHNLYNIMCAIAYAYIYRIKPADMRDAIINFTGDKFRIENVGNVRGINFVNDSKSTNIASTLASVESIKGSIILLLGGSDKKLDFSKLFSKLPKRVKQIFAYGEIADDIISKNTKFNIQKCENLNEAFDEATKISLTNDTILLSPATASYDQYKNYIERGIAFNNLVSEYEKKQTR